VAKLKFTHYIGEFHCNYASIMYSNAMTGKDAIAISSTEGATTVLFITRF